MYGLELLPEVLEVPLLGPWSQAPRPPPGAPRLLEDPGPLRQWHAGFRALDARRERPPPLGPALAEAFLDTPELFLPPTTSRFTPPALDLYAPKKGAPVHPARKQGPSPAVSRRLLALCAGLSLTACSAVQVREADQEWLEDCPREALAAMRALGLAMGEPYEVWIQFDRERSPLGTPFFIREGPVTAVWRFAVNRVHSAELPRMKGSRWLGRAQRYGERLSVRFDRVRLADGSEHPVCGVAHDLGQRKPGLEAFGYNSHRSRNQAGHPNDPKQLARLEALEPGEFPIGRPELWVSLGILFPD